jgi:hypothetical protein
VGSRACKVDGSPLNYIGPFPRVKEIGKCVSHNGAWHLTWDLLLLTHAAYMLRFIHLCNSSPLSLFYSAIAGGTALLKAQI